MSTAVLRGHLIAMVVFTPADGSIGSVTCDCGHRSESRLPHELHSLFAAHRYAIAHAGLITTTCVDCGCTFEVLNRPGRIVERCQPCNADHKRAAWAASRARIKAGAA